MRIFCLQDAMRDYVLRHPEQSISLDDLTKNTLTKAERQLKDKFDGRPTKPPPYVSLLNVSLGSKLNKTTT